MLLVRWAAWKQFSPLLRRTNDLMIEYIFNPTLWSILGLILIVLELTDGSKIFFLPFGLASIANGILIYFQNNGSFNETIILKYWHSPLISVGLLAIAFALILRLLSSQKKDDDSSDINEY